MTSNPVSWSSGPSLRLLVLGTTIPPPMSPKGALTSLKKLRLIPFLGPFVPTTPPMTWLLSERQATIESSFFGPSSLAVEWSTLPRVLTLRPILTCSVRKSPVTLPPLCLCPKRGLMVVTKLPAAPTGSVVSAPISVEVTWWEPPSLLQRQKTLVSVLLLHLPMTLVVAPLVSPPTCTLRGELKWKENLWALLLKRRSDILRLVSSLLSFLMLQHST